MSKLKILFIILIGALGTISVKAAGGVPQAEKPRWEQVSDIAGRQIELTPVKGVKGVNSGIGNKHLYLEVADPTRIELFTILGQPIITADLKPGLHRLKLSSRGIYLLRIGNATIRIKY